MEFPPHGHPNPMQTMQLQLRSAYAKFDESAAANLTIGMRFAPLLAETYRIVLVDYLRFNRQYIVAPGVDLEVIPQLKLHRIKFKTCYGTIQ